MPARTSLRTPPAALGAVSGRARVLEVGAGDRPFRGVTHVVELHPDESHERFGVLHVPRGARLVQGSLEALPFRARAFEVLYARHVLEHVHDARRAVDEINRVAKRGYLETPSPLYELLSQPLPYVPAHSMHRWFVWTGAGARGGRARQPVLHAARKAPGTMRALCACADGRHAREIVEARWQVDDAQAWQFLTRGAKYTKLVFRTPVAFEEHATLADACASGACALGHAGVLARSLFRADPHRLTPELGLIRAQLTLRALLDR